MKQIMYGNKDIFKIEVTIHPNQTPETKHRDFTQDYWGWVKKNTDIFTLVQPSFPQFSMQFTYGFKANEDAGEGKAYRLK